MNMHVLLALEQLVFRFWRALDHRNYGEMLNMMAEECRWVRGRVLEGKAQIGHELEARPSDMDIRHLVSNFVTDELDDRLAARYTIVAFSAKRLAGQEGPLKSRPPTLLADIDMRFSRAGEGFLILNIEPVVVFRDDAP
jgi:hypothetical protein